MNDTKTGHRDAINQNKIQDLLNQDETHTRHATAVVASTCAAASAAASVLLCRRKTVVAGKRIFDMS